MKILFTIALTFAISSTSFGQNGQRGGMFWNNYSNFNPAMSGFQYKQHGAASYTQFFRGFKLHQLNANYNMRIGENHGVGLNYSRFRSIFSQSNLTGNYNYQFDLKRAGKLSVGTGIGVTRYKLDFGGITTVQLNYITPPEYRLQLNYGIGYKLKGLTAGIGVLNQVNAEWENTSRIKMLSFNAHTEYKVEIGEKLDLTPRAIYVVDAYGDNRLITGIAAKYNKRFTLGALYDLNASLGFHAGWDIKEKFRISYFYNIDLSNDIPSSYFDNHGHQLTLGFHLK